MMKEIPLMAVARRRHSITSSDIFIIWQTNAYHFSYYLRSPRAKRWALAISCFSEQFLRLGIGETEILFPTNNLRDL